MKLPKIIRSPRRFLRTLLFSGGLGLLTVFFLSSHLVFAADPIWTGVVSTDWNNNGNWTSGKPSAGELGVFDSSFTNQPNVGGNISASGMWMTGSIGQNVTLSGSGTLKLGASGLLVDNANSFTLTITAALQLTYVQTWTNNSGNLLTIAGDVDTFNRGLTINGSGNTTLSGVVSNSGPFSKSGSGTVTLSGANTYTGTTTVSAGTLAVGSNDALGTNAAGTTVSSGATVGFQGGINYSTTEAVTLNGTGASGRSGAMDNLSGNNGFAGNITLSSAATIGSASGTLTLNGTLTNGGFTATFGGAGNVTTNGAISGTGGLTKTGSGTATLGTANTFSGVTTISGGTLSVNADNALGGTSKAIINTGGTLLLGTSTASNNRIGNSTEIQMNGGIFGTNGYSETVGKLTLTADSSLNLGVGSSVLTFSGASSLGSSILWVSEWSGTPGLTGGTDRILFTGSGFTAGTVTNQAGFWVDGQTYNGKFYDVGGGTLELAAYQLAIIPEPGTIFGGAFLVALAGWRERRRLRQMLLRHQAGQALS